MPHSGGVPRPTVFPCLAACAVLLAAGCSSGGRDADGAPPAPSPGTASAAATGAPQGPDGAPECRPASPIAPYDGDSFPEVRATGHGIRAWGLMMPRKGYPPLRADQELKVVWRVTGSGPLSATATGPDGRDRPLAWGPEPHDGSSYKRPGDEWGVGYRLDDPGCWHMRLTRGSDTADVWLRVT